VTCRESIFSVFDAIQITQATYELIKDEFECEPRCTLIVKGKGEMEVWLVTAAKESI
jgi:guanylate cyclase